jgi:hypothetical protein
VQVEMYVLWSGYPIMKRAYVASPPSLPTGYHETATLLGSELSHCYVGDGGLTLDATGHDILAWPLCKVRSRS